jgi:tight adherence protein B
MNTFIILAVIVWAAAMLAWYLANNYLKSNDADRVKARLLGTQKVKVPKGSKAEAQVIHAEQDNKNKLAQMVVERGQFGPKIRQFLEQAGLNWQAAHFVHISLVAFCAGFTASWLFLPVPRFVVPVIALVAAAGPYFFVWRKKKLRLKRFEELFPDTLEFVSRSMRAGHAFSVSLEMIHKEFQEPVAGEFRRTFEEHNLGLPMDVALVKLAQRVPSLDVHFFVSAVLLQKRTGGNLAEILDKLAYVIRERFKLRGRIRAVSAHGKMTATALSCIPLGTAVLMFYANPDYVKFFFTDELGQIMMGCGVGLQLIGYFIMKQIVNIEV